MNMVPDLLDIEDSLDSASLQHLTDEQKIRLTALLDEYLQNLEKGVTQNSEQLLLGNPDLQEVFGQYITKLQRIYGLATHQRSNLNQSDEQPLQFRQLGDFEIVREIGRGGMGVVYEAKQLSLGRSVALKLLSLSSALDPRQIARFHNESRAAGLLQHPNIVPVYSVGFQQGIHYYAMQLINGVSIDQWIDQERLNLSQPANSIEKRNPKAKWQTVVEWGAQIADALHVAHEAGIVHRDVKPSNLLVDQSERIWITDFGLARCTRDKSTTASGVLVGTMRYMSPEQASGQSTLVDAGADIYGLAASIYEMLVLHPAIEGEDAPTILKRIAENQIRPLRAARPDLPRDLAVVLSKAMAVRQHRYQTALEFAEDLRRVLAHQPTIARPATLLERFSSWAVRHQRTVLLGISAFVMAMVGLLVSLSLISSQKRKTESIASRNANNERIAREAVDRLGAQMAERLAEIPAASGVRRQLLEETLDYYQQYAANAQNSPDLRRSLALTKGKIGELQGELGNNELAIAALRDSESAFHELAQAKMSDSKALSEWATSLNNLGQALHRQGEWQAANNLIEQAIELQSSLVKNTDSDEAKIQLATSWSNLALSLANQAATAKAEGAYQKSIELIEKVTNNTIEVTIQLATVKTNLSGLLSKSRPADAIKIAQQALKSEAAALERQPDNVRLSKQTALTLAALATAQADDKQYFAALETYKQAVDIGQQLVTRWPDQPQYRVDLATNLNQLGVVYSRVNRAIEAHDIFTQALDHQRKLAAQFPNDAEVISTTGSLLNNFGFLCLQLQQRDQAVEAFEEAVKFQAEAVRLAPQTSRYAEYLQKHQTNLRSAQSKRK